MDALKALELIEQVETSLGDMYGELRRLFADDKEMSGLFAQLEAEEANHANMATMQKRIVRAKPADFKDVDFNFSDLRSVLDHVAVVRTIPRNRLAEILVQCYLIESSMVEQYVVLALRESNAEMAQLIEMLSHGFRDHLTALAGQAKAHGGDLTNLDVVRSHPRVSFSGKVTINQGIYAKGVDISESGIFLLTTRTFPKDERVTVSFPIMNSAVTAASTVRYSVPNAGIGLSFTELSDDNRSLIRQYVDSCMEKQMEEMKKKQATGKNDQ